MGQVLLALVSTLFLVTQVMAGAWTSNNFLYKPAIGARGEDEKAKFDSGLDRVDSRLANEKWLNDSPYNGDLGTAITAIGSAKTVLSLPAGNWPIAANLTVPANLTLKLARGALLTIATGKTLTINGPLDAGLYQIFSCTGTGKALFARGSTPHVCPEWWYSGTGSYHTALNAAYHAYSGTYTADPGSGATLGYVSIKLSQLYTVTNSPWLLDDLRSGKIIGVGKGISGIYQSGTGDAISVQTGPYNAHLTLRDFSVIGNPTSGCGITTNGVLITLKDMDILSNGSHGFYSSANGWEMKLRDVYSSYNGGDGFRWGNVADNLQFIGGGAIYNTGIGINCNVNSLTKTALIQGATMAYNAGGGAYLFYGQYNVDSCYFEGNTGIQINTYGLIAGKIAFSNFYNSISAVTMAIKIDSPASPNNSKGLAVTGNIFAGNNINIWQSGYAATCVIGPNVAYDGTNTIYGTNNVYVDDAGSYVGFGGISILTGIANPSTGAGVAASIGSLYTNTTTGQLYSKTGAAATAWTANH